MNDYTEINASEIAAELAQLPETVDSNDWPHRNKIIYTLDMPNEWASICSTALNLTNNQILKIRFLLEYVNGRRRNNPSAETLLMLNEILDEARDRIELNPEHASHKRLLELWAYHSGYVSHMLGDFKNAVKSHEISYSIAQESDVKNELLALFNLECERLNAAIAKNKDIKPAWNNFWDVCNKLMTVLDKTKEENMRWMANACYNLMLYSWLIEKKSPDKVGLSFLEDLPDNIKPAFVNEIILIKAINLLDSNPQKAVDTAGHILTDNNETHAMALIIMARAKLEMGENQNDLEEIIALKALENTPGTHLAQAIMQYLF